MADADILESRVAEQIATIKKKNSQKMYTFNRTALIGGFQLLTSGNRKNERS